LSRRRLGLGNKGSINSHCSSVNSFCRFFIAEAVSQGMPLWWRGGLRIKGNPRSPAARGRDRHASHQVPATFYRQEVILTGFFNGLFIYPRFFVPIRCCPCDLPEQNSGIARTEGAL
jgi:hypothetical protein